MKKKKLSIIILSWNTEKLLKKCLKSVFEEGKHLKKKIEVIVVDNGSTDGSVEMVKKSFSTVSLVENNKNLGFAKGNNIGINKAQGEFIMLLNSDTVLKKGSLKTLLDFSAAKENSAFSPLLFLPDGKAQIDYYMKFPNLWQVFFYHNPIFRPIALKIFFLRNRICSKPKEKSFKIDQLPGAALLAGEKVWKKVGVLDEDYSFLYEDVDWCFRAKKKGISLFVVPDSKVLHIGGASWKKKLEKESLGFYKQYFSSMLLFVGKNYSKSSLIAFRICLFLNFLILGVFYFFFSMFSFKFFKKAREKLNLAFYCLSCKTASSRVFL